MSKSNQKIADLGGTIWAQPSASRASTNGCTERTVADLRRFLKGADEAGAMVPSAGDGPEPGAEEGVRLIKAFVGLPILATPVAHPSSRSDGGTLMRAPAVDVLQ